MDDYLLLDPGTETVLVVPQGVQHSVFLCLGYIRSFLCSLRLPFYLHQVVQSRRNIIHHNVHAHRNPYAAASMISIAVFSRESIETLHLDAVNDLLALLPYRCESNY